MGKSYDANSEVIGRQVPMGFLGKAMKSGNMKVKSVKIKVKLKAKGK